MEYVLLATEGPDDQAILCSLFKNMRYQPVNENIDSFWQALLPKPKPGSVYAYKNLLYPYFFTHGEYSVAIYQGRGSALRQNLQDILMNRYAGDVSAFGVIIDADDQAPSSISKGYADKLRPFFPSISDVPGEVIAGPPRTGIYVFPDCKSTGTLDTLLLDCASLIYPEHKQGAEHFLDNLDAKHKERWNASGRDKALLASIVSVLQPGRANHASFADQRDEWVSDQTLKNVAGMISLWDFIHRLIL